MSSPTAHSALERVYFILFYFITDWLWNYIIVVALEPKRASLGSSFSEPTLLLSFRSWVTFKSSHDCKFTSRVATNFLSVTFHSLDRLGSAGFAFACHLWLSHNSALGRLLHWFVWEFCFKSETTNRLQLQVRASGGASSVFSLLLELNNSTYRREFLCCSSKRKPTDKEARKVADAASFNITQAYNCRLIKFSSSETFKKFRSLSKIFHERNFHWWIHCRVSFTHNYSCSKLNRAIKHEPNLSLWWKRLNWV